MYYIRRRNLMEDNQTREQITYDLSIDKSSVH